MELEIALRDRLKKKDLVFVEREQRKCHPIFSYLGFCKNAFLWLTRAMDFIVELFKNLIEQPDWTLNRGVNDSYSKTLKKWHGWLASSSFAIEVSGCNRRWVEEMAWSTSWV